MNPSGMNLQNEARAKSLNDEFPGLNEIAQRVFGVDYETCTSNLRTHVKVIAQRDAAHKMYEALLAVIELCPKFPAQVASAIHLAEGRQ